MANLKVQAEGFGRALVLALAGGMAFGQTPPSAGEPRVLTDPETGRRYPLVRAFPGKADLRLETLGVGHRKLFGVSYYSIALYVDLPSLRKAMGGHAAPSDALRALEAGGVSLCLDLQYTRGVSARRRGEVIRERLVKAWEGPESYEKDPDAMKLLEFFSREAKRGDESFLWFHPDGRVLLQEEGKTPVTLRSHPLRRFLTGTYLGPDSVSQDLKQSLFSRLDGMLPPQGVP